MRNVAILGASTESTRYSNMAMHSLLNHHYNIFLITPKYNEIDGHHTYKNLSEIKAPIDVLTVYINPNLSSEIANDIIKLSPKVVIFNPGSENDSLAAKLEKHKIKTLEACTLVLLNTNQFEHIF
jgi:predicted CoA-binding protein